MFRDVMSIHEILHFFNELNWKEIREMGAGWPKLGVFLRETRGVESNAEKLSGHGTTFKNNATDAGMASILIERWSLFLNSRV